jgi:hypothetical protein
LITTMTRLAASWHGMSPSSTLSKSCTTGCPTHEPGRARFPNVDDDQARIGYDEGMVIDKAVVLNRCPILDQRGRRNLGWRHRRACRSTVVTRDRACGSDAPLHLTTPTTADALRYIVATLWSWPIDFAAAVVEHQRTRDSATGRYESVQDAPDT